MSAVLVPASGIEADEDATFRPGWALVINVFEQYQTRMGLSLNGNATRNARR